MFFKIVVDVRVSKDVLYFPMMQIVAKSLHTVRAFLMPDGYVTACIVKRKR